MIILKYVKGLIFLTLFSFCLGDINPKKFPANFKFGSASAATQVEGAALEDGRSESIWDYFVRKNPGKIIDGSTPNATADFYHNYELDISNMKDHGVQMYRFSISWSRVLPNGDRSYINKLGVHFYQDVIKKLKDAGIEPLVTLYHWDLPQILQSTYGGWLNETVTDLYADYARLCFELFGNDVKNWLTINEPKLICQSGYGGNGHAPGVNSQGVGEYVCSHNVLLAHAKAYHIYDKEFRAAQKGKVSIVLDSSWAEPGSDSQADKDAAEIAMQFSIGLYAHPVYKGDWPKIVKDRIAMRSKLEGFNKSRLPEFTEEHIKLINGTYDFMALNHYTTLMVNASSGEPAIGKPSYTKDQGGLKIWKKAEWLKPDDWISVVPWGLRKFLSWMKNTYADTEIMVTENGMSDHNDTLLDDHRVHYLEGYWSSCLDAIYKDDVKLVAHFVWSFTDSWEWGKGFTTFMGLNSVNYTDPKKTRLPKMSLFYLSRIIANRCLVKNCVD